MGKIIVIGSQKGGVGKTTTTHNLAYSLKELGKKVLTVDFDSQANLTTCYGVEDTGALEYTIGHLMMDQMEEEVPESFEDYIQSRDGVDYLPSSIYLSVVDAKLRTEMGAERMLAEVLEPLKSRYDYILIDTCPGKLLQMANGAVYSDEGDEIVIHDQKLDALEDMIEAANGRPVMVAYWFKHDLSRIMRRLSDKKIPFEKLDSEESIRKWNRGELQVALIHPASAGHGLNLQSGGNMLIWFGLTWSLELYQQTVARLWRQGQTSETVVVQHIITAGTIDEDVMKALASKDMTQNRLIAAVKARVTHGR